MALEQGIFCKKKNSKEMSRVLAPNFTPTGCVPTVTVGACSFTALLLSVKSDGGDSGPLSPVLTLEQTEKKIHNKRCTSRVVLLCRKKRKEMLVSGFTVRLR
jgi:hypothetical protein